MTGLWALLCALAVATLVLAWNGSGRRPRRTIRRGSPRRHPPVQPGRGAVRGAGVAEHALEVPRQEALEGSSVPLLADALAALMLSGQSLDAALAAVGDPDGPAPALGVVARRLRWGDSWEAAWFACPGAEALREPLQLCAVTGAPPAALLLDSAQEHRRAWSRRQEEAAAAMGVRLVLPLGLCALPAFICLGIVPVALALLPWA